MSYSDNIRNGAETALINYIHNSAPEFKPKLIINDKEFSIADYIKKELLNCDEFIMSSAFVTENGLKFFEMDFDELSENVNGKILTTNYLYFTDPKALKMLKKYPNIESRLYDAYDENNQGFHTKGYLFRKGDVWTGIVGSANLTRLALTINNEWNIKFKSLAGGELLRKFISEFNKLWVDSEQLSDFNLRKYESLHRSNKIRENFKDLTEKNKGNSEILTRNSMQDTFINKVMEIFLDEDPKKDRALLISATGTGKTYASAFAIKEFQNFDSSNSKVLFLVHRNLIANQAKKTFKKVLGVDKTYGLFNMNERKPDADYIFANITSLCRYGDGCFQYESFAPDEFDYIIVDEVHRAGSDSYKMIFDYFKPKFWLGMSASPERTDGVNIFELFNYNIAHEIRLQEALENDLLCPFYYYGISDLIVNDEYIDDMSSFNKLTSDARIDHLLEKSLHHGFSGNRMKALVFCSGKREAKKLAEGFTQRGHNSIFLSGNDSDIKREEAIHRLTSDSMPKEKQLEYIFTIDIFNEGVDIPEINQVLLVRPTESPIIFIQQLGRGLRKFEGKEYVVILDFIGQYKNNYMIANAFSGDPGDKDKLREFLRGKSIVGSSLIQFDQVSREIIYESINRAPFHHELELKNQYAKLKSRLGRMPMLCDYLPNNSIDPLTILNHDSFDCYHSFLEKYETDYNVLLDEFKIFSLKFISKKLANGKRPHELIILKFLRDNKRFNINDIENYLSDKYDIENDFESIKGAINVLSLNFYKKEDGSTYQKNTKLDFWDLDDFDFENIFFRFNKNIYDNLENNKDYEFVISDNFSEYLANPSYMCHFNDLIEYSLLNYGKFHDSSNEHNLKLYAKYSREDFCRILNWPTFHSQIQGYVIKHNMCPIFVTYNKNENVSDSINYKDEFISNSIFSWMSRNTRTFSSKDIREILDYEDKNIEFYLFVKKSDGEGKEGYYLGKVTPILSGEFEPIETTILKNGENIPIVNFKLRLEKPVEEGLYDDFIKSNRITNEDDD